MNIWLYRNWEMLIDIDMPKHRTGLRFRFEKNVDPSVKSSILEFAKWLRHYYFFPIRVPVYIKASATIRALDGDLVSATFFEPFDRTVEPYIRVATGDYEELVQEVGKEAAHFVILETIAHELTHYFQWINNVQLTEIGYERQASRHAHAIVLEYISKSHLN